jgi:hypothetical protein
LQEREARGNANEQGAADDQHQMASSSSASSSASSANASTEKRPKQVVNESKEEVKKKASRVVKKVEVVAKNPNETAKNPKEAFVKKANNKQFIKERPKLPTAPTEMVEPENQEKPPPPQRKYPQRGPRINYTETDDDHFLCE